MGPPLLTQRQRDYLPRLPLLKKGASTDLFLFNFRSFHIPIQMANIQIEQ